MEYWCNFEDELWSMDPDQLIRNAKEEIVLAGLVPEGQEMEGEIVTLTTMLPGLFPRLQGGPCTSKGVPGSIEGTPCDWPLWSLQI